MHSQTPKRPLPFLICGSAVCLFSLSLCRFAAAQDKSFIDYLKPTPISCAQLSSETWGVAEVLPRDLCNGIESAKGAGVPPEYYYWDGKILKDDAGTYHMFMSMWSGSDGFNPGWFGSESYHAVSTQGVLGPYERKGYIWDGDHHGHNTTACELLDGTYAVVVSEVVPFTIYQSDSLDGPWTACPNPTGELIQTNGVNAGSDTHWDSNVSLIARHDGKFQIVQRHGLIAIADDVCGPYLMQTPTWTYPAENIPSIASIYPHRTSQPDPGITNPTYGWEEDPTIWYSGGRYHVLYSGSQDRIGYELSSPDGIHDWRDGGLAFSPRMYDKIFGYENSSVENQWYKMERPGVVLEDGHVTHVTWSVADVDKDNQIPAGSNHGSKIIVVPFDGLAFDADTGDLPVDMGTGGESGSGGADGAGGMTESGGTGGAIGTGGAMSAAGGVDSGPANGGSPASGGAVSGGAASGGTMTGSGAQLGTDPSAGDDAFDSGGCSCALAELASQRRNTGSVLALGLLLLATARRRRRYVGVKFEPPTPGP